MSPKALVNQYLGAFYTGNFSAARTLIAESFQFNGPFVQAKSRDDFFASASGLLTIVKGHTLLQQWDNGDQVCSIYDVQLESPAGKGTVTMSEWHTIDGNQLQSSRIIFDTATFRAILPLRQ